eukprot:3609256-Prorocentrum_lima.AAC.1
MSRCMKSFWKGLVAHVQATSAAAASAFSAVASDGSELRAKQHSYATSPNHKQCPEDGHCRA